MRRTQEFYSLAEAKAKFSQVVEDSQLKDVVVTKNGKPVAVVLSYDLYSKLMVFLDKVWDLYLLDVGEPSVFGELSIENFLNDTEDPRNDV